MDGKAAVDGYIVQCRIASARGEGDVAVRRVLRGQSSVSELRAESARDCWEVGVGEGGGGVNAGADGPGRRG